MSRKISQISEIFVPRQINTRNDARPPKTAWKMRREKMRREKMEEDKKVAARRRPPIHPFSSQAVQPRNTK